MFEGVIQEYAQLEPAGVDVWNILYNQHQYWHRYRLMAEVKKALQKINLPEKKITVLDVGCGVGRSSRMLLELGLLPKNITGIDIREDAIRYAKSVNSNINFLHVENFDKWPDVERFDLIMQCTAFSSINSIEERIALAQQMQKYTSDNSHIFWWDLVKANSFAGADKLDPDSYFSKSKTKIFERKTSLRPTVMEAIRYFDKIDLGKHHYQINTLFGLFSPLTHKSILYKF
jgi:SAM-dependent methyltransferase